MMLRPRASLALILPLIFATLFATRTLLGQTADPSSPSATATEDDRAKRLQFLKARAPGLRPLDSNSAEPTASQTASPAEKPVAASKPTSTPTSGKTASKSKSTSDNLAKSATAKTDAAKKPALTEKSGPETSSTTAKTVKIGNSEKTAKTTSPEKTTASTVTPASGSSPAKEAAASKSSEATAKTAATKEPSKKPASTERSPTTSIAKAPAKPTPSAKLADASHSSEAPSKPASRETPKPTSALASTAQALNKPATESLAPIAQGSKRPVTTITRITEPDTADSLRLTSTRPRTRYPWKTNIVTTVFWIGERPAGNNFTPNYASSWDMAWSRSYGGYDNPDPDHRRNFIPVAFKPKQNNFYVALPYNDVTRGTTKPEARRVIPWFSEAFEREGQSVCRNRWVAIRNREGKVAYAQWSDCGPFRTDHWQYVFGSERPKPNLNQGAGLDVSPAVRDFLGLRSTDITDWKFVDLHEVPSGPWCLHGDNNTTRRDVRRMTKQSSSEG